MAKSVRSLSARELTLAADELMAKVERAGFYPDALVAIETGGRRVVDSLTAPPCRILSCRMVRATTEVKKSNLGRKMLRWMPYSLSDRLRLFEDWLDSRAEPKTPKPTSELVNGVEAIAQVVVENELKRLLVVDDAVDSGGTLGCVVGALRARLPEDVEVLSAVLTRTRPPERTAVEPDLTLYSGVLLRFPWSFDYKSSA